MNKIVFVCAIEQVVGVVVVSKNFTCWYHKCFTLLD